jgi:PAS domain S-box-containing protein
MLTEAIPQQIWRTDASGCIEYCNQHLCDYLGRRAEELQGEAFFSVIHPEDKPLFRQGWQAALANAGMFEIEVRVRGTEGIYHWFLVRSVPKMAKSRAGTEFISILNANTAHSKAWRRRRTI